MIVRVLVAKRPCERMDCSQEATFEIMREDGRAFRGASVGWHGTNRCNDHLVRTLNLLASHGNEAVAEIDQGSQYQDARGAVPWEPGMKRPEEAIREGRGYDSNA